MRIEKLRAARAGAAARKSQEAGGEAFTALLASEEPEAAVPIRHPAPAGAVGILPDIAPGPAVQDREARRHGGALLRALGGLQIAALTGERGEALRALAALAADRKAAADPGLDQVLRAIAQRAAIELARPG